MIQHGKKPSVLPHQVCLQVFGQVVTAHEALGAVRAGEALFPGVCAQVPLELIRARETFPAKHPAADEGSLTRVPSQVRLQVRRLAVNLAAARYVARVLLSPARRVGVFLAIRTHASPASPVL